MFCKSHLYQSLFAIIIFFLITFPTGILKWKEVTSIFNHKNENKLLEQQQNSVLKIYNYLNSKKFSCDVLVSDAFVKQKNIKYLKKCPDDDFFVIQIIGSLKYRNPHLLQNLQK